MTRTYYPVASCDESRKSGFEREDWEATPSSTPAQSMAACLDMQRFLEAVINYIQQVNQKTS
ncbi:MAG: hypothetical protein EBE86_016170 [Hormoscilla sp. GUM202]|nr:hypothetical protein [Hormoscilla sp. GUM202]